ncbi:hypothetical protein FRC03_008681 [Tulasnella sp. 419]|nr:hypothetical protein FRC02_011599 [Tulasnella sp. 418]KAG8968121.1 hypothetical protein FRC03_008681 [Tulasnella sp. 419]
MSNREMQDDEASLISRVSVRPNPDVVTKIIKRLRALTLKLLPLQVDTEELVNPTSRIITPSVISAYSKAAGDYAECLPYCLLRTRQGFMFDANSNPADYDENFGRAIACEVLARRIVHNLPPERINAVLSARFRFKEWDGDTSSISSALETAIDQHCTIFLSSNEAQSIVIALWRGEWVQKNNDNYDIDYVEHKHRRHRGFLDHLNPSRLTVPLYQNWFRILIWLSFLFAYSMTVQQPLEMTLDPRHPFDAWEYILYIFVLAFTLEELHRVRCHTQQLYVTNNHCRSTPPYVILTGER